MTVRASYESFQRPAADTAGEAHRRGSARGDQESALFLLNVGLDYLTLDRSGPSLSGGEAQRIRLASQLGSELSGVIYVLDEPSIGLHQRDNQRLIETLRRLRDLGNTVLVVEHDEETIRAADHVVDFGPGAGHMGDGSSSAARRKSSRCIRRASPVLTSPGARASRRREPKIVASRRLRFRSVAHRKTT